MFLFFSIELAILGLLSINLNFRVKLSVSTKELSGNLMGLVLNVCVPRNMYFPNIYFSLGGKKKNLLISLGRTDNLVIISLPIDEHGIPLHLFRSYFFH